MAGLEGSGGGGGLGEGDLLYQQQPTSVHIILNDSFIIRGKVHRVSLTRTSITWEEENTYKFEECVPLSEVILAEPGEIQSRSCFRSLICSKWKKKTLFPEPQPLHINAFKLHFVDRAWKHRWKLQSLFFTHADHNVVRLWITSIRDIIKGFQHRPKRLVVFVNPFGGKKKAPHIYDNKVRPLFELAHVEAELITTERANHATDTLMNIDLSKYDGVICVGGDGMFSELLNGMLRRTQVDVGIDVTDPRVKLCRPKLRLGVIPGGSTDAVAYCTSGTNDPVTAALRIVLGDSIGLDVCSIHQGRDLIQFSTTLLAYGYFGDTLLESEKYRWMGPKRYDWSGFKKFLQLRSYEGEVAFRCLPPSGSSPLDTRRCSTGCKVCSNALRMVEDDSCNATTDGIGWQIVKGKFVGVNNATTTCACARAKKGISPAAHLGDGCTDLILVEKCSRFSYLRYMLATAIQSRNPFDLNFVKVHRVREFQFRPRSAEPVVSEVGAVPNTIQEDLSCTHTCRTSVWNCDGEIISEPSISVRVHCQLVNVFSRGIEDFPSSLSQDDFEDVVVSH